MHPDTIDETIKKTECVFIGEDEKLTSVIAKDMKTKVNYNKGLMTNLMIEYEELIEKRKNIYWELINVQKKLDVKIIELKNMWSEI